MIFYNIGRPSMTTRLECRWWLLWKLFHENIVKYHSINEVNNAVLHAGRGVPSINMKVWLPVWKTAFMNIPSTLL